MSYHRRFLRKLASRKSSHPGSRIRGYISDDESDSEHLPRPCLPKLGFFNSHAKARPHQEPSPDMEKKHKRYSPPRKDDTEYKKRAGRGDEKYKSKKSRRDLQTDSSNDASSLRSSPYSRKSRSPFLSHSRPKSPANTKKLDQNDLRLMQDITDDVSTQYPSGQTTASHHFSVQIPEKPTIDETGQAAITVCPHNQRTQSPSYHDATFNTFGSPTIHRRKVAERPHKDAERSTTITETNRTSDTYTNSLDTKQLVKKLESLENETHESTSIGSLPELNNCEKFVHCGKKNLDICKKKKKCRETCVVAAKWNTPVKDKSPDRQRHVIREDVEPHVVEIEPRVGKIEPRVGKIEPRVGKIEPHVVEIEPRVGKIEPRVIKIEPQRPPAEEKLPPLIQFTEIEEPVKDVPETNYKPLKIKPISKKPSRLGRLVSKPKEPILEPAPSYRPKMVEYAVPGAAAPIHQTPIPESPSDHIISFKPTRDHSQIVGVPSTHRGPRAESPHCVEKPQRYESTDTVPHYPEVKYRTGSYTANPPALTRRQRVPPPIEETPVVHDPDKQYDPRYRSVVKHYKISPQETPPEYDKIHRRPKSRTKSVKGRTPPEIDDEYRIMQYPKTPPVICVQEPVDVDHMDDVDHDQKPTKLRIVKDWQPDADQPIKIKVCCDQPDCLRSMRPDLEKYRGRRNIYTISGTPSQSERCCDCCGRCCPFSRCRRRRRRRRRYEPVTGPNLEYPQIHLKKEPDQNFDEMYPQSYYKEYPGGNLDREYPYSSDPRYYTSYNRYQPCCDNKCCDTRCCGIACFANACCNKECCDTRCSCCGRRCCESKCCESRCCAKLCPGCTCCGRSQCCRAESILGLAEVTDGTRIWRMLLAEFLGTFLLVFIGCGTILTFSSSPSIVQISLTFGLLVGSIVQCIGHISGGHINPAVTISFFVVCEIKLIRTLLYIVAQLLGAAAGAGILKLCTPDKFEGNLGITNVTEVEPEQGFGYEVILTFLLVFIIHAVCDPRRKDVKGSAPLAIGLAVAACHLSGIKYSGSSLNPARSFGPALVANLWANHWVYWAGPILGGILAAVIYKFMFKVRKNEDESYDF